MPRLYLSPSLQEFNLYAGGGNEEYYMNLLADAMEPALQSSGVTVLRNDLATQELRDVIRQSNASGIDLHLALHSNAAGAGKEGQVKGVEVYYNPQNRFSRKAADFIAARMREIYPNPSKVQVLPTETLVEVLQVNAPSVLVEVGYHDNWEEAQWIRDNLDEIAKALVKAVCDYFGIPYVPAQPVRIGIVHTGGANLNLRQFPSTQAKILAAIPNDSKLTVLGRTTSGWSVVHYGDQTGYVKSEFII